MFKERRKWRTTRKLERKNTKDMDYNRSSNRPLVTITRHGGLGHEVQEWRPYLSNATPWPYELSCVKNEFSLVGLTALSCCCLLQTYKIVKVIKLFWKNGTKNSGRFFVIIIIYFYFIITVSRSRLLSY